MARNIGSKSTKRAKSLREMWGPITFLDAEEKMLYPNDNNKLTEVTPNGWRVGIFVLSQHDTFDVDLPLGLPFNPDDFAEGDNVDFENCIIVDKASTRDGYGGGKSSLITTTITADRIISLKNAKK